MKRTKITFWGIIVSKIIKASELPDRNEIYLNGWKVTQILKALLNVIFYNIYLINWLVSQMGCAFSEQNMHASLKRIKRDKIIHAATLNYCGILKSPF